MNPHFSINSVDRKKKVKSSRLHKRVRLPSSTSPALFSPIRQSHFTIHVMPFPPQRDARLGPPHEIPVLRAIDVSPTHAASVSLTRCLCTTKAREEEKTKRKTSTFLFGSGPLHCFGKWDFPPSGGSLSCLSLPVSGKWTFGGSWFVAGGRKCDGDDGCRLLGLIEDAVRLAIERFVMRCWRILFLARRLISTTRVAIKLFAYFGNKNVTQVLLHSIVSNVMRVTNLSLCL